jgi:hypothetical protein
MIEADTLAKLAEQCAPDIKLIFHRGLQAQSWAASYSPLEAACSSVVGAWSGLEGPGGRADEIEGIVAKRNLSPRGELVEDQEPCIFTG